MNLAVIILDLKICLLYTSRFNLDVSILFGGIDYIQNTCVGRLIVILNGDPDVYKRQTYMRGLCMLGVIGIHVGSYALQNPFVNLELISVLEILSRFGVPAFFFLSAFGLFYHTSVSYTHLDVYKRQL